MNKDVAKILVDEETIEKAVTRIAAEIDRDYSGPDKNLIRYLPTVAAPLPPVLSIFILTSSAPILTSAIFSLSRISSIAVLPSPILPSTCLARVREVYAPAPYLISPLAARWILSPITAVLLFPTSSLSDTDLTTMRNTERFLTSEFFTLRSTEENNVYGWTLHPWM